MADAPSFKAGSCRPAVIVVGGGLAGLTAATALHRAGIGFQLLEARSRLGGRILSVDASGEPSVDGFDLGPSWFWPDIQPDMAALADRLGLAQFPQNGDGDIVIQRTPRDPPRRYAGMRQEPRSMRFVGGTGALVSALASHLPVSSIQLGVRVTHVALNGQQVQVAFTDSTGPGTSMATAHVIFALPPRLLAATVSFAPALDALTAQRWHHTPTWMAPHAKFFAVYDHPFWRDLGLSGKAQSMLGPLVEIHDATMASGQAALFGFAGVPAEHRAAAGRDAIIAASVKQLAQLFGPQAATPRATLLKDWAADPLTATADDVQADGHPVSTTQAWVGEAWQGRIWLAGSETSRTEPGYLAGAIEAAERTVAEVVARLAGVEERTPTVSLR